MNRVLATLTGKPQSDTSSLLGVFSSLSLVAVRSAGVLFVGYILNILHFGLISCCLVSEIASRFIKDAGKVIFFNRGGDFAMHVRWTL